jgi:hypothetical protein
MIRRILISALSLAIAGLTARSASAAAAVKSALEREQERARQQVEQSYRGSREQPGTMKMPEVCRLRFEKGKWLVGTSLPAGARNQQTRVNIEGLPGITVVNVGGGRGLGFRPPDSFNLSNHNFSDPAAIQITTIVQLNYGSLTISRTAQTPVGYSSVTLSQGNVWDEWGQAPRSDQAIVLSVQNSDRNGQGGIVQYTGADLPALRRQHPKEVTEHLRPLLRQLHLESVLAVDALTAWQAFADELKPDAQVQAEVHELLPALDSDQFQEREAALGKLQGKGKAMALAVAHMDRSGLTDQQNTLLDTAVAPFRPQRASELAKMKNDADFLLDCLYAEDEAVREVALEKLRSKLGREVEFDLKGDFDKRSAMIDAIRLGGAGPATKPAR